jgi:hypothetical protein
VIPRDYISAWRAEGPGVRVCLDIGDCRAEGDAVVTAVP